MSFIFEQEQQVTGFGNRRVSAWISRDMAADRQICFRTPKRRNVTTGVVTLRGVCLPLEGRVRVKKTFLNTAKILLPRSRCRWEDNINMNLRETACEGAS